MSQKARYGGVFSLDQPRQRSKEELRLAAELGVVFPVDFEHDAIRTRGFVETQPFVTPDVLIPSLRVAVEWDGEHHRKDPTIDVAKEEALCSVDWHTIRASVRDDEDHDNVIAAPGGLTLDVVHRVMSRLVTLDPLYSGAVEQWRARRQWMGSDHTAKLIAGCHNLYRVRNGRPRKNLAARTQWWTVTLVLNAVMFTRM